MVYNLAVTPMAFSDILDASVYYENILPKLSERFLLELSDVYHRLAVNPQHFGFIPSKKKSSLRSSQIKGFPYLVTFDLIGDTVNVYSVFNTHRKPKYE